MKDECLWSKNDELLYGLRASIIPNGRRYGVRAATAAVLHVLFTKCMTLLSVGRYGGRVGIILTGRLAAVVAK